MDTYTTYQCKPCNGTGKRVDATNADKVSASGYGPCAYCKGKGTHTILATADVTSILRKWRYGPRVEAEERFPQLTTCRFCKRVLRRDNADEKWTNYGVAGTTSTECEKAPNPDDGPMPPHEPGTKILTPPDEPDELVNPATLPTPVIPQIPSMGRNQ